MFYVTIVAYYASYHDQDLEMGPDLVSSVAFDDVGHMVNTRLDRIVTHASMEAEEDMRLAVQRGVLAFLTLTFFLVLLCSFFSLFYLFF